MKLFSKMYDWVMVKVRHPHAPKYLYGMSFAESVFFPIPPDVMLAPMSLAKPDHAWRFAMGTTLASVIGGVCGYLLGWGLFDVLVQPLMESAGYMTKYEKAVSWFEEWGVWVVFLAGFSPIPYKVFTITAGVMNMLFLPFLIASAIGRGMRFFMVSALMVWGGEAMERRLREYVDVIGWATVALAVVLYLIFR